jgi:hypothetical protein
MRATFKLGFSCVTRFVKPKSPIFTWRIEVAAQRAFFTP